MKCVTISCKTGITVVSSVVCVSQINYTFFFLINKPVASQSKSSKLTTRYSLNSHCPTIHTVDFIVSFKCLGP